MQPINFPQANNKLAKSQPQYKPLPVYIEVINSGQPGEHLQYTCRYELTDLDIEQLKKTRAFYFSQFGNCFHPILPQINTPFGVCNVSFEQLENGNYNFAIPMSSGGIETLNNVPKDLAIDEIMLWGNLTAEQIYFYEKPTSGIDEGGNIVGL